MLEKKPVTLYEGLIACSRTCPEKTAMIYGTEQITYGQLWKKVQVIRESLKQMGVTKGEKVVVSLPRSIEQVATYYAILTLGAAYVPISIKQPTERKQQIITDVATKHVIESLDFIQSDVCVPEEEEMELEDGSAYVIYTSGSTGVPKGVEMTHGAAINTLYEIVRLFGIGTQDVVLNVSSSDFDLSIFDFFAPLLVGGTIVLIDDADYRNPAAWMAEIQKHQVTIWNSAPALLEMLASVVTEERGLPSLRLALVSGDWISLQLPEKWKTFSKEGSRFVSLGGATEAGIWSNYYIVEKIHPEWVSIPYGKALKGQAYRIVNDNVLISTPYESGELWIGGKSLAEGYLHDPEKTKAKFVYDEAGERWYRTGDLGQYQADGNIEFLGRMDFQVKVRGHRIELGEIEQKLEQYSGMDKVVAAAMGDKFHKELVVFYTGQVFGAEQLRNYLLSCLPEYSVPYQYIHLDEIPLNANGKVNRNALEAYAAGTGQEQQAAESVSDHFVVKEWEQLIGKRISSLEENIFTLGVDSLTIAKFIERMRTAYNIALPFHVVFEHPTIKGMMDVMDDLAAESDVEEGEI